MFYFQERQLASDVVHILEKSEAEDYIPIFARHRMTPETFLNITDNELRQVWKAVGITQKYLFPATSQKNLS